MTVVDFKEAIRARLSQMSDELMLMQEAVTDLPDSQVAEHCRKMDEHARIMSKLASRLYEGEIVPDSDVSRKGAKAQSSDDPKDAA